jgi:hypothetical protein
MSLAQDGVDFMFKTARLNGAVDAALFGGIDFPPPTPCPIVLAWLNGTGARGATDAGVTLVVKRVVRDAILADVIPNLFLRPIRQRIDLDDAAMVVVQFPPF